MRARREARRGRDGVGGMVRRVLGVVDTWIERNEVGCM